jgi:hypothetical protein
MVALQIVPERVPFRDHVTSSLYCIDQPVGPDLPHRSPRCTTPACALGVLPSFFSSALLPHTSKIIPRSTASIVPTAIYPPFHIRHSQHDSHRLLFGVHLANVYRDSHSPRFPLVRRFVHLFTSWNRNMLQNHCIGHPFCLPHSKLSDVGSVASLFINVVFSQIQLARQRQQWMA